MVPDRYPANGRTSGQLEVDREVIRLQKQERGFENIKTAL